jgi:hypothetical protein
MCAGSPRLGVLRRLRPTQAVQQSTCLSRPTDRPSATGNRAQAVPVFTVVRSAKEEPDCVPATSPRVRRRPSPWPPRATLEHHPGSSRHIGKQRDAPRPAHIHQIRAGVKIEGRNNAGSSRTPLRHSSPDPHHLAVLTRPGFVRAAPTLPGVTRTRLPPASPPCCDKAAAKVSHLRSNHSASRRKPLA